MIAAAVAALFALAVQDGYADPVPTPPPAAVPDQAAIDAVAARVQALGDLYADAGRCAGHAPPEQVEGMLRSAQAQPAAGPYLLRRFEEGFRKPKGQSWCTKAMTKPRTED